MLGTTLAALFSAMPAGAADTKVAGSVGAMALNQPVVDVATTPAGDGYWRVARDGGVFSSGAARFYGSTGGIRLNSPIVGIAASPTGRGYWFVAEDGGIFSFGDARFYGSTGAIRLNSPIVGMAATPTGRGYWLVARDGGIFSFGDARFYGSTGAIRLNSPIVGMAATPTGRGYWFVGRDGGIFSFGDARFYGSTGAVRLNSPITDMAASRSGRGYWFVGEDGGIFSFGDARFMGSAAAACPDAKVAGIGTARQRTAYWVTLENGRTYAFTPTSKPAKCTPPPLDKASAAALDLLARANAERAARGLAPLRWDDALATHARDWSKWMAATGFRHSDLMPLLNTGRYSLLAENIGWARGGGVTSGTLHVAWMESDGHRANLLSPAVELAGMGVVCGPDGTLWGTQVFARPMSAGAAPGTGVPPRDPIVRQDPGTIGC